jgi:hypothetical protein
MVLPEKRKGWARHAAGWVAGKKKKGVHGAFSSTDMYK